MSEKYRDLSGELTDDEKVLIVKINETFERDQSLFVFSDFMTPREQIIVDRMCCHTLPGSKAFWGGYTGSERRCLVNIPSWVDLDDQEDPLSAESERSFVRLIKSGADCNSVNENLKTLRISGSGYRSLGHRDWMGSILNLGIERRKIGDIVVIDDYSCYVFTRPPIDRLISSSLDRVSSDKVKVTYAVNETVTASRKYMDIDGVIASPRLDNIVKTVCKISRDEAAELISKGNVQSNYFVEKDPDSRIDDESILTIKGYGKFRIDSVDEVTKKGRIKFRIRKYM